MLADWCCGPEARAIAGIRALWLFEGRLGDEGAVQVARILAAHPGMAEVWCRWAAVAGTAGWVAYQSLKPRPPAASHRCEAKKLLAQLENDITPLRCLHLPPHTFPLSIGLLSRRSTCPTTC
jgi:hypothetical protein